MSTTRTTPRAAEEQAADIELGVVSNHEAAHAVATLRLGGQVRGIRIWEVGPARWQGVVNMRFLNTTEGHRGVAVALLVGAPAERRWLEVHNVSLSAYRHDVHAGSGPDRDSARDCLALIPRAERPTFREVEREAALLVDRCWDRVEHLADRLARSARLHHVHA
jgi:hypothetical protein